MEFNYLEASNAGRLRDILARRIASDESDSSRDVAALSSAYSFLYKEDALFFGLHSRFATAHWDERLQWLLHEHLKSAEIERLGSFAKDALSPPICASRQEILKKLNGLSPKGPERELIEYWKRNLYSFPEEELCAGLQRLTREVQEDLTTGPESTIRDLNELQKLILNRHTLHLDLTISEPDLREIRQDLDVFVKSIPQASVGRVSELDFSVSPVRANLERRYHISSEHRPLYLAFMNPDLAGGDVAFYCDFAGYSQLDHQTLVRVLAAFLFSGSGPHSFFAKTWASGLAYQNYIGVDPALTVMWYYANKSPDIPSLLKLVNATAGGALELRDRDLVDYVLAQFFTFSREMGTTSTRGKEMAHDLRDGNDPEKIRRFSKAILKLRQEPDLLRTLTKTSRASICGVLLRDECKKEHEAEHSLFFFVGAERVLAGAEKQIPIPDLKRLYASDFWMK